MMTGQDLDWIKNHRLQAVLNKDVPLPDDLYHAPFSDAKLLFLVGFTSEEDSLKVQAARRAELKAFFLAPKDMRKYARVFVKERLNTPEEITLGLYRRWLERYGHGYQTSWHGPR